MAGAGGGGMLRLLLDAGALQPDEFCDLAGCSGRQPLSMLELPAVKGSDAVRKGSGPSPATSPRSSLPTRPALRLDPYEGLSVYIRPPEGKIEKWGYVVSCPRLEGDRGVVKVNFSDDGGPASAEFPALNYHAPQQDCFKYSCPCVPEGPLGRWHMNDHRGWFRIFRRFDPDVGKYKMRYEDGVWEAKDGAKDGETRALLSEGPVVSARWAVGKPGYHTPPESIDPMWAVRLESGKGVLWLQQRAEISRGSEMLSAYVPVSGRSTGLLSASPEPFDIGDRLMAKPMRRLQDFKLSVAGIYEVRDAKGKWRHGMVMKRNDDGTYDVSIDEGKGDAGKAYGSLDASNIRNYTSHAALLHGLSMNITTKGWAYGNDLFLKIDFAPGEGLPAREDFLKEYRVQTDTKPYVQRRYTEWDEDLKDVPCSQTGAVRIKVRLLNFRRFRADEHIGERIYQVKRYASGSFSCDCIKGTWYDDSISIRALNDRLLQSGGEDWTVEKGKVAVVIDVDKASGLVLRDSRSIDRKMPPAGFALAIPTSYPAQVNLQKRFETVCLPDSVVCPDGQCHAIVHTEECPIRGVGDLTAQTNPFSVLAFVPRGGAEFPPQCERLQRVWLIQIDKAAAAATVRWRNGHIDTVSFQHLRRALRCDCVAIPHRAQGGKRLPGLFCHQHACNNVYCGNESQHLVLCPRCSDCTCTIEQCWSTRDKGGEFCKDHKCIADGCTKIRKGVYFCEKHDAERKKGFDGGSWSSSTDKAVCPPVRAVRGLANMQRDDSDLVNVCYMNSVVQCLSAAPGLSDYLRRYAEQGATSPRSKSNQWTGTMLQAVSLTLNRLWESGGRGEPYIKKTNYSSYYSSYSTSSPVGPPLRAEGLRAAAKLYSGHFGKFAEWHQQQCSLEFWFFIREWMHRDFLNPLPNPETNREWVTDTIRQSDWPGVSASFQQGDDVVYYNRQKVQHTIVSVGAIGDIKTIRQVKEMAEKKLTSGKEVAITFVPDWKLKEGADKATVEYKARLAWENYVRTNDTPLTRALGYSTAHYYQCGGCACRIWKSQGWVTAQSAIPLYIETGDKSALNLQERVDAQEIDDTEVVTKKCPSCAREGPCRPKMVMYHAPELLVLYPQRVPYPGVKLTNALHYPVKGLDLSRLMVTPVASEARAALYDLYGIVCHTGYDSRAGHYTAYTKSPIDGEWYKYDDLMGACKASETEVRGKRSEAYILYYQRRVPNILKITNAEQDCSGMYYREVGALGPYGLPMWRRDVFPLNKIDVLEGQASDDKWWPIMLQKRNSDGSYCAIARVGNSDRTWPRVQDEYMRWKVRLPSRGELQKKSLKSLHELAEKLGIQSSKTMEEGVLRKQLEQLRGERNNRTLHSTVDGRWCIAGSESDLRAGGRGWLCSTEPHHFVSPHRIERWAQSSLDGHDPAVRVVWQTDERDEPEEDHHQFKNQHSNPYTSEQRYSNSRHKGVTHEDAKIRPEVGGGSAQSGGGPEEENCDGGGIPLESFNTLTQMSGNEAHKYAQQIGFTGHVPQSSAHLVEMIAWMEEQRDGPYDGGGAPVEFFDYPDTRSNPKAIGSHILFKEYKGWSGYAEYYVDSQTNDLRRFNEARIFEAGDHGERRFDRRHICMLSERKMRVQLPNPDRRIITRLAALFDKCGVQHNLHPYLRRLGPLRRPSPPGHLPGKPYSNQADTATAAQDSPGPGAGNAAAGQIPAKKGSEPRHASSAVTPAPGGGGVPRKIQSY